MSALRSTCELRSRTYFVNLTQKNLFLTRHQHKILSNDFSMFEETAEARPIVVTARVQQVDNRRVSDERRGLSCSTDCLPHVSSRTKKISWSVCGIVSLTVIITLLAVSLKKLSSVEYGLEYDRLAKELDDAAKTGGLHIGPPGFEFVKFPSTQISQSLQDTCVSQDGLRVEFTVSFQYSLPAAHIVDAVLKYRNYEKVCVIIVSFKPLTISFKYQSSNLIHSPLPAPFL